MGGVRKCDKFGFIAPQRPRPELDETGHPIIHIEGFPYPPVMDEDCLYMNIYTSAETSEDKLPVFLYLHGGGLQEGYGSDYEYCGDAFCRQNCIQVTINYRMNVFGYFVHPELAKESGHDASGNYGTMDQIQALKWVVENIAAFGGDPDNITVAGQSGGGRSVQAICCSPHTKGLFQHAVIHSAGGAALSNISAPREEMERRGVEFMESLDCANIAELRALPWQTVFQRNFDNLYKSDDFITGFKKSFNLYADGWLIPIPPEKAVVEGLNHDVDYIIGCTVDEGHDGIKKVFGTNMCASQRTFARMQFENKKKPLYMYCFDRPQPGDDIGTPHSCDMRYLFGTLDGTWRPYESCDFALSETMRKYWVNFARTGDPNGDGLAQWTPFLKDGLELCLNVDKCEMRDYGKNGNMKADEDAIIENTKSSH